MIFYGDLVIGESYRVAYKENNSEGLVKGSTLKGMLTNIDGHRLLFLVFHEQDKTNYQVAVYLQDIDSCMKVTYPTKVFCRLV